MSSGEHSNIGVVCFAVGFSVMMAKHFPGAVLAFDSCNERGAKLMRKTWLREAGITDVSAFFILEDEEGLRGWSDRFSSVTAKSYMRGYRNIYKNVGLFYKLMIRFCDSLVRMKIITGHTGWTDDLDFAFCHRMEICRPFTKKYTDPSAPYDGKRQMSRQIIEGITEYIHLPVDGKGLDVGCGSGALTIACAKHNPGASFIGIDRWGKEYASFNKPLCESNAKAEGVSNVAFRRGDATGLDFPDESFDAVTSNYVYHNIPGDRKAILLETLRVLKKGGTFALHDIFSKAKYGDMSAFVQRLRDLGFESVELIDTTDGKFMTRKEVSWMALSGAALLIGRK